MKLISFAHIILDSLRKRSLPGVLIISYRITAQGRDILLIKSKHSGAVTFPSGHINLWESYEDAAKRELYEEAGVSGKKLKSSPLVHTFIYPQFPIKIQSHQKVFVTKISAKAKKEKHENNVLWARWFSYTEALEKLSYPELGSMLRAVRRYLF